MRKQKRQTVKKLIQCAAIIAAGVLAIILFMWVIWCRGKNSEPVTDEQVAAQMQQAEPLVIETPEAATEGSIRVYDYDGCCIYSYYGKIRINNDGKNGKDIDVETIGYLEGYQEHNELTEEDKKAAAEAAAKAEEEKAAAEAAAKAEEEKAAAEAAAKAEEEKAAAKAEEEKKVARLVKVKVKRRFRDMELNQIKDAGDAYTVSRERAAVLEEAGVAAVIEE